MLKRSIAIVTCWTALAFAADTHGVWAQDRPLALLVPSDAGLYVELHDLTGRSSWFAQSDLYRRLQTMAPFGQWQADLIPRIAQISRSWSQELDMEPSNVWTKIFGQEMIFAVWPKDSEDPGPGHGLLLLNAADGDLLLRVVKGLGSIAPREGDAAEVRELHHAGATYWERSQTVGGRRRVVYLAAADRVGIVTSNKGIMKRVLELSAGIPTGIESLADLPAYRDAAERWRPDAPMRLFVNPVAWDPWMVDSHGAKDESEKGSPVTRVLRDIWRASESWIASIEPGPPVIIDGYVKLDRNALSPPVRELLESLTGKSEFLGHVPEDAVIALGARVDVARMNRLLADESQGSDMQEMRDLVRGLLMGMDVFDEVSQHLGPDVGSYLLVPDSEAEGGEAVEWVVGLRTTSAVDGQGRPVDARAPLDERLRTSLQIAADALNARRDDVSARVETVVGSEGVRITGVDTAEEISDGQIRAYAFDEDYLIAGTSRDIVRRTATLLPEQSLATSPKFQSLLSPWLTDPSHVLYVDCAALRAALHERPESLPTVLAAMRGFDSASLRKIIWQLTSLLHVADSVALSVRIDDDGVAFAVGVVERASAPKR